MIRLLIADDHPVVRQGIKTMLAAHGDLVVAAEAADGHGLLKLLATTSPDVLLLDVSMPGPDFAELVGAIRAARPLLPILVLSVHSEEQFAVRALRLGAAGYLPKDCSPHQLGEAIRRVARGGRYVSPAVAERLAAIVGAGPRPPHEALSEREHRVLALAAAGKTVKEIAAELALSSKTVSTYRKRILQKLDLRTHAEAIRFAITNGLVD